MNVVETSRSTPGRLEVETVIDAPPDVVWRAFVNAEALTDWWAEEADLEAVVGGAIWQHFLPRLTAASTPKGVLRRDERPT